MKSTARLSFIITALLYATLLLVGYWLFSSTIKEPKQLPEKLTALPVSLNMFQATAPTMQTISTPEEIEVKVIEKPEIKPIVKPSIEPIVVPKPEAIIAKPVIKKPALPVKPVVVKPTIVKPKAVKSKPPEPI
jgi:outer membrane biosynthesis protein TonB